MGCCFTRGKFNEFGELQVDYLLKLNSHHEFEQLVKSQDNIDATYVTLITVHWKARLVFQTLTKHKCKITFINWGMMPIVSAPKWQRVVIKITKAPTEFVRLSFEIIFMYLYRRFGLIKPLDVVFSVGTSPNVLSALVKKTIQFNSIDYDRILA